MWLLFSMTTLRYFAQLKMFAQKIPKNYVKITWELNINNKYVLRAKLHIFNANARNDYTFSTTNQKSDVILVFPDSDFLWDEGILAIRPKVRAKLHILIAHARNGHTFTFGQKSDVIIVLSDPDLL